MTPEPITVAAEWVAQILRNDPGVVAQIGQRSFFAYAPARTATPHLTHDLAAIETAAAFGPLPPAAWTMVWQVTVWGDGAAIQRLRAPMQAALAALVGSDLAGRAPEPWPSADGSRWVVSTQYHDAVPSPPLMPSEVTGAGEWARIAHAIRIELVAA